MASPCVVCSKPKRWRNAEGKCTDCAPIVIPPEKEPAPERPGPKKL